MFDDHVQLVLHIEVFVARMIRGGAADSATIATALVGHTRAVWHYNLPLNEARHIVAQVMENLEID